MDKKIRVALIVWSLPGGGLETFLLRLGGYLLRQGMEVDVVTTEVPGAWFSKFAERGMTAIHQPGWATSFPLLDARRIARQLIDGKYDVILLNNAKSAQKALRFLPDNVVAIPVVHGMDAFSIHTPCINAGAWNVAITVSPQVRDTIQRYVGECPVVCIPHGVELPASEAWEQRAVLHSPVHLVYIGRLFDEEKGVFALPQILHGVHERGILATLTIAGDGPDRERLQQQFRDCRMDDYVNFTGFIAPEEVYPLLLAGDILLFPSRSEGFGLALAEAKACGCVPVASRLPGVTDTIVEDGETGYLVAVGDIEGFVSAVVQLAGDPALWEKMSKAGHDRAQRCFSIETMGQAYMQIIEEALAGKYPLPQSRAIISPLATLSLSDFVPNFVRALTRLRR
ncbi:MAG: glycosyltransferase family 4 protein [bacterium]